MSPCNPFFSLLQHNPFYDDKLTAQPLKPSLPPLPYLSSARPPIAQLFPQASNSNPTHTQTTEDSIIGTVVMAEKRPLPLAPIEEEKPLSMKLSNPFMSAVKLEPDSEWDESFEAFAAGRLQSPEDLTKDCKTQQNTPSDHPLEHCNKKGALLPTTDQNTNVNDALPCTEFVFEAHKAYTQATNTYHLDSFAQFLETIPEHTSFESDNITLNTSTNSPKLDACTETNQANSPTNTSDLTDTNMHQARGHASSVKLNSSSPDPGSSGLGSSAEEDFLSCLSSYSDKFSASSSEEAEAQNFESNILCFEQSSDSSVVRNVKPSESEDDITDRSNDLSLVDVAQHTVVEHSDGDEKVGLEGSLAPQSPVLTDQQPARDTGSEDAVIQSPNFLSEDLLPKLLELQPKSDFSLQPDNENGEKGTDEFSASVEDLSKDLSVPVRNTTEVIASSTPDVELCSTHPSLYIITSSPDVKQSLLDLPIENTSLEGQDASQPSPIPFKLYGDLLNTSHIASSPGQDFDDTLLHTRVSDQSTSSFFQSLYVSTDSQDYQTCASHPSSNVSSGSEPNVTLHSVNSTLCGELSEIQTSADAALGQEGSTNAFKTSNKETNQIEGSFCGAEDKTATLEPSLMIWDDFGLLPAPSTDCDPRKLAEGGLESQQVVVGDVFSKCPQAQSATLHRSQSEGTLTPAFDELLLPSFGSYPGGIQESSSADLPPLTSFAPFLTPQSSSSPVALCSLPPFANATAWSSPSAAPKPMLQDAEQQQHQPPGNQQNR